MRSLEDTRPTEAGIGAGSDLLCDHERESESHESESDPFEGDALRRSMNCVSGERNQTPQG